MKTKIVRSIKIWLFALFFPFLDLLTIHRTCDWFGDGGPEYYGLPFVWRTQIPWGSSMSGDFYVLGYLGNVLFYFLIAILLIKLFQRIKLGLRLSKFIRICSTVIVLVLSVNAFLFVNIIDWNFQIKDDRATFEKGAQQKMNCVCELEFFKFGS